MNTVTIGTYRQHRNTKCVHCGHVGFSSEFPDEAAQHPGVCCHCRAAGRTMPNKSDTVSDSESDKLSDLPALAASEMSQIVTNAEPVTWGGHVVKAPGFSADQFERAMVRAFADDLQVKQIRGEQYIVHHAGLTHGYRVSRERCDCPAGQVGTPCKHRAVLIAHLDIRAPYVDRQWRKLQAERPAPIASAEVA